MVGTFKNKWTYKVSCLKTMVLSWYMSKNNTVMIRSKKAMLACTVLYQVKNISTIANIVGLCIILYYKLLL